MAFDFSELVKTKTTDELTLVFSKPSNYQPEMVAAATAELTSRNIDLSDLIIKRSVMEKRGEELLSVGKSGNTFYLLLCFVASILGGFAGIIGGYIYAFSKTSSSRGKSFYVYDEETRKYGRIIFGVAIAFFVCSIMYSLNKHFGM